MALVKDNVLGSEAPDLVRKVARTVLAQRLVEPGDGILVSVSGGPDSVALLSILAALSRPYRLRLWVVHFNHGLRGAESDEDACFVGMLCKRLQIVYHCERLELSREKQRRGSIQAHARTLRYAALLRLAETVGATKVALGHTQDDQAETVLMWLLRGAGTSGLAGIRPRRTSVFIRPMLHVRRSDIVEYLRQSEIPFRTDSSNAKPYYFRNRIRHELLPLLEALRPGTTRVLARQADILQEEDRYLAERAAEELSRLVTHMLDGATQVDRNRLRALPTAIQRRIVRHLIGTVGELTSPPPFGAVAATLDRVVQGRSGASLIVQGVHVAREYDAVTFRQASKRPAGQELCISIAVPSVVDWPATGQRLALRLMERSLDQYAGKLPVGKDSAYTALFDADRFTMDLVLRTWQRGDAFQPLGMAGRRKKLQDFFTDHKIPRERRKQTPVLVAPEGILWVVGHRIDHRVRVTGSTRRVLLARLLSAEPREAE